MVTFGTWSIQVFASLVLSMYAAIWVHELGHVLAGRATGLRICSVGIGTGGHVLWFRFRGIAFYMASRNPFQGLTFSQFKSTPHRGALAVYYSGGILANLLVAGIVILVVGLHPPPEWWATPWVFGAWNLLFGAASLFPFSFRIGGLTSPSDGALLLQVWKGPIGEASFTQAANMLHTYGGLWRSIGDGAMLSLYLLTAARFWVERMNPIKGAVMLDEAERVQARPSQSEIITAESIRAWLAVSEGRADEAERASNKVAAQLQSPEQALTALVAEIDRAERRLRLGNRVGALELLNHLEAHPSLAHPYCRAAWEALAFCVGKIATPPESLPPDQPAQRLWLQSLLSEHFAEVGNRPEVESRSRMVLAAIEQLSAEFVAADDRAAFTPLREHILGLRQRYPTEQGHTADIEDLEPLTKSKDPERAIPEWRLCLLGVFGLFALFLSVGVTALTAYVMRHDVPEEQWLAAVLVFYAISAGVFGTCAGLLIVVYALMRCRNRDRVPDYGRRSLIATGAAFGTSVLIGFLVWLLRP